MNWCVFSKWVWLKMQRLAIFGGTFNPPHVGHLKIAEAAEKQYALDQVLWVPSYASPHRVSTPLPDFSHRVAMVNRAIAPYPRFKVSAIEQYLPSPSYAVDMFEALQSRYPEAQWFYIIGLDAFQRLPLWHRHADLIPRCTWLIAPRIAPAVPSHHAAPTEALHLNQIEATQLQVDSPEKQPAVVQAREMAEQVSQYLSTEGVTICWQLLNVPFLLVSSSLIRQRWGDRLPIDTFVPPTVLEYLQTHKLYIHNHKA